MKKLSALFIASALIPVLAVAGSSTRLRVVATVPDLADITRRIGGEWVQVETLARGVEDIHNVPQRPSFVPKLNRADAVVLVGLEMEHAFLPALLEVAQNPRIRPGAPGYIDCSVGVKPLDVPTNLSRSEGELHPYGNPHYTMDPRQGGLMADNIAASLSRLDPTHAQTYAANRDAFKRELEGRIAGWRKAGEALAGTLAVSHHQDMAYLADFLGLKLVGTVELKPGIAPTPTHLRELVAQMKAQNVKLLIREIQFSDKTARWIADQTGARLADVSTMAGAYPDNQTYFDFIDRNIRSIVAAAKAPGGS